MNHETFYKQSKYQFIRTKERYTKEIKNISNLKPIINETIKIPNENWTNMNIEFS
jgi:hypothetical protein